MSAFFRQHSGAIALSLALHVAIVAALTIGFAFAPRRAAPVQQLAIEAVVVDLAAIEREAERLREEQEQARQQEAERERQRAEQERQAREQAEQEERERQAELDRQREREAAEQREREAAAERERQAEVTRQAEQQRQAEEERQRQDAERQRREEEARLAREREEAERQRQAEEERRRQAEEQRRRQEEEQRRLQAEAEAELQRALEAENELRRAEDAGLLAEYERLIRNRITQNWIAPPSARAGLECIVYVMQIPGGEVVDVRIGRCNGDAAVQRSIEAAVLRASPLPPPPVPALFQRNLEVTFRPDM
jgi:colicin import membrane protein